tara:strand:+ start:439 stop:660 length:222 start_codon:yes stop_codon:yes gene_type:complete
MSVDLTKRELNVSQEKKQDEVKLYYYYFTDEQIDNLLQICEFKLEFHRNFPDDIEEEVARDLYNHILKNFNVE